MDSFAEKNYVEMMDFDSELDAIGLLCPLPVLKARKWLQGMQSGQTLRLLADDPAAVIDVPHYCNESGNIFVSATDEATYQVYLIRKA